MSIYIIIGVVPGALGQAKMRNFFAKQWLLRQFRYADPVAEPYHGDAGVLLAETPAGFKRLADPDVRAVVWIPRDGFLHDSAADIRGKIQNLDPDDRDVLASSLLIQHGQNISEDQKSILSARGLTSIFKQTSGFMRDRLDLIHSFHVADGASYILPVATLMNDKNDSMNNAGNRMHREQAVTQMLHVPIGPGTVWLNDRGENVSLPENGFLLFKGVFSKDPEMALWHRSPIYSNPQPRMIFSSFGGA